VRLFCFPYAGGGASVFAPWAHALPREVEVSAIEAPGHGSRLRERALTRLDDIAAEATAALLPHLDRPFALFGHSLGGLVAFEVCRRLRAASERPPECLLVSASGAPQTEDPDPDRPLHRLPDAKFLQKLGEMNGTPDRVLQHDELMRLMLPMLRADMEAYETYTYVPGPPLAIPITAFGGLYDAHVTRDRIEAWRDLTVEEFATRLLPGDHFFIHRLRPLLLQHVAAALQPSLRLVA
jgi:surfactin synthase thioesterase subunit